MQDHSPLPWEVDIRTGCWAIWKNGETPNCVSGSEDDAIVFQNGRGERASGTYRSITDEQELNARFIVRACNSHLVNEGLVEALGDIVRTVEAHEIESLSCDNDGEVFCECLRGKITLAKAALAAAEGADK